MADLKKFQENLAWRGISYRYFETGEEAAAYLDSQIDGETVGMGGSFTSKALGLYPMLGRHNQVFWHWEGDARTDANAARVYLCSANAAAETGELVNIDGNANRVAASVWGPKRVYFVLGINKLCPDFESALYRARNVAAPQRAQSLGRKTPCAVKGDRCYDCKAPERVCRSLMVHWCRPTSMEGMEVIVVNQVLGM